MRQDGPQISVVIPTYNRANLLERTLESLVDQSLRRDRFEVIVSDDGSADRTQDLVNSFSGRLNIRYRFQEDSGYRVALARNEGARLAAAPVLAFLDSGVMAGPELLEEYVGAHASMPGTVILGYTYGYEPYSAVEGLAEATANRSAAEVHDQFGAQPGFRDMRHDRLAAVDFDLGRLHLPWMFLWSLNFSVRADDYWAAGGFDEDFTSYGTEDVELGFRMVRRRGLHMAMSRRAWAIEQPYDRDIPTLLDSCERTTRQFLDKSHVPEVEVVWAVLSGRLPGPFEERYEELLRCTRSVRDTQVAAEIEKAVHGVNSMTRVCVIGCGNRVPDGIGSAILLDFDESLLGEIPVNGAQRIVNSVGLDVPVPDGSVDVVVLTSRLAPLGHAWNEAIMAEACRIGGVVLTFTAEASDRAAPC